MNSAAAAYHARQRAEARARQLDGATHFGLDARPAPPPRSFDAFAAAAAAGAAPDATAADLQTAFADLPRGASEARYAEALGSAAAAVRARAPRAAPAHAAAVVEQREDAGELAR